MCVSWVAGKKKGGGGGLAGKASSERAATPDHGAKARKDKLEVLVPRNRVQPAHKQDILRRLDVCKGQISDLDERRPGRGRAGETLSVASSMPSTLAAADGVGPRALGRTISSVSAWALASFRRISLSRSSSVMPSVSSASSPSPSRAVCDSDDRPGKKNGKMCPGVRPSVSGPQA